MIEVIRSWLVGITCAAAIVALAETLSPPGSVRKIGRLTGSLVLLLAILHPVFQIDSRTFAGILSDYRGEAVEAGAALNSENSKLIKDIIEEKTCAYILDKAQDFGIKCQVAVTTVEGEGGYPIPDAVVITGDLTQRQQADLTRRIAADLAIPAERQSYQTGGKGETVPPGEDVK